METIRTYLENMFKALPDTNKVREAKRELLSMMEDKYFRLIEEGKTENEAVGKVINEFGNLDELAEGLGITNELGKAVEYKELDRKDIDQIIGDYKISSHRIALGSFLILFGVSILIGMLALAELNIFVLTEDQASIIGVCAMLVFVALAVYLFIKYGMKIDKYDKFEKELVDLSIADKTYLENVKDSINFPSVLARSVILFVVSCLPILIGELMFPENEGYSLLGVVLCLWLVGLGVYWLVKAAMMHSICQQLLQEGDYEPSKKMRKKKYGGLVAAYWLIITLGYFTYSFLSNRWDISWLIWPISGILYGIVSVLANKD